MKLFSYIVRHDTGFAPNPFWGTCTLACCKPVIRRTAQKEDWVVGLSPKSEENRLTYAMCVDDILDFAKYYENSRFESKKPEYTTGKVIHKTGDNIYKPLPNGSFQQLRSMHSYREAENPKLKEHDLGGMNVLIAKEFYYFGGAGKELPSNLDILKVGRGHKNRFSQETISEFLTFIKTFNPDVNAHPTVWPADDDTWRQ